MSNFTVNGIYSYTSSQVYSYLGNFNINNNKLKDAFREFGIAPTGKTSDLQRLNRAIETKYSHVKEQVKNQTNNQQNIAWASVCGKIGVNVTGDYEKDRAEFFNAIQLLSQNAPNGEVQSYLAGIKTEAMSVFSKNPTSQGPKQVSFNEFERQYWNNMH
ncbi:MAG: hypothetical protein MJ231_06130 [bacterium]|nr:hypothetical protein [bacterium]